VERAAVVGEGIVVVAVEEFDRFEDRERRIHRTVAVVRGQKPRGCERTIINIDNLVDREEGGRRGSVGRQR